MSKLNGLKPFNYSQDIDKSAFGGVLTGYKFFSENVYCLILLFEKGVEIIWKKMKT